MKNPPSKSAALTPERPWTLPTHQRRSRRNRDRLLKIGERVFAMHGFADAHVSEIAALAGCSIGSFYRRFRDKEALFMALQDDMYDQAQEHIERFFAHPAGKSASLTLISFKLIETAGQEAARIKGYYRALYEISLRGGKVWGRMRDLERLQAEHLRRLLLERKRARLRPDFVPAVAGAIRMIMGNQLSLILYGPGPFHHNDPAATCEHTRILLSVAGVPVDESELTRLRRRRAR